MLFLPTKKWKWGHFALSISMTIANILPGRVIIVYYHKTSNMGYVLNLLVFDLIGIRWAGLGLLWRLAHFQQYIRYIVVASFISGGNFSTRKKPPTWCRTLTNFITLCCTISYLALSWKSIRKVISGKQHHWVPLNLFSIIDALSGHKHLF